MSVCPTALIPAAESMTDMPSDGDSSEQQPASFMTLPTEVRIMVYEHFEKIPGGDLTDRRFAYDHAVLSDDFLLVGEEFKAVAKTRTSLLLVSRQVEKEWAPIFYRSKKFLVNSGHHIDRCSNPWDRQNALLLFGDKFLKTLASYKLRNICKLSFDLNWNPRCAMQPCVSYSAHLSMFHLDLDGATGLPKALQQSVDIMQSLEEVTLFANLSGSVSEETFVNVPEADYLQRWWETATVSSGCILPRVYGYYKIWDHLRTVYVGRNQSSPMAGWKVEKHIIISLPYDVISWRAGHGLCFIEIRGVKMVFRKPIEGSVQDTEDKTTQTTSSCIHVVLWSD